MNAASTSKQGILNEIRRTAEANGSVPLGRRRFLQETGIKVADWEGKYWARWSDALLEAGYSPNQMQDAYSTEPLIEKFISLARELGHYPVTTEIKMKARRDDSFPSHNVFGRFGKKRQLVAAVLSYCKERRGYEDVIAMLEPVVAREQERHDERDDQAAPDSSVGAKDGYVYLALMKVDRARRYKIGNAVLVERRTDQISPQLPEELELVHVIKTDDAYGIEAYWHRRFASKRTKGEWFTLSRQDVEAFKRRKFM
jgi:hypothetical protein